MSKEKPSWLLETSEFCRSAGIKIMAWGPDTVVVEATQSICIKPRLFRIEHLNR